MNTKTAPSLPTHIAKATGCIEISEPEGRLSLADRKLFTYLLANACPNLGKQPTHVVYLANIRQFAATARAGVDECDNRGLKISAQNLQRTIVVFNYLDSDKGVVWKSSQLLGTIDLVERTGELTYSFPLGMEDRLKEPALYSYISLKVTFQFRSKYSLILYELLKRFADRDSETPYWSGKTSQLRDLLGCRDRLKNWKDFRRNALDPAMAEIGAVSEFTVELIEARQGGGRGGGCVVGVTFRVHRKHMQEAELAAREIDKTRLQRRGEKKLAEEELDVGLAMRWMSNATPTVRLKWEKRAADLGVAVPRAAISPENLIKWVPSIAQNIVREERLS